MKNPKIFALAFLLLKQQGFVPMDNFTDSYVHNPRFKEAYKNAKQILRHLKIRAT